MVDFTSCDKGMYRSNVNRLFKGPLENRVLLDGVDVYADYQRNTFRLSHAGEKEGNQAVETFEDFGTMINQKTASTGEGVVIALNSLWKHMFGENAQLLFLTISSLRRVSLYTGST